MVKQLLVLIALFSGFNSYVAAEQAPEPAPIVIPLDAEPVVVTDLTPVQIVEEVVPVHKEILIVADFDDVKGIKFLIGCMVPDQTYWAPSNEWVVDALLPAWIKYKEDMELVYGPRFDCDDFAKAFSAFANMYYASHRDNHAESLAVAQYLYIQDSMMLVLPNGIPMEMGGGGHAINVIILSDKTALFIEPQSGEVMVLSETEMANCHYVLF